MHHSTLSQAKIWSVTILAIELCQAKNFVSCGIITSICQILLFFPQVSHWMPQIFLYELLDSMIECPYD